jgi:polyisoprenyl-teichoic acid--peptidoglycan teichoic acid transferase
MRLWLAIPVFVRRFVVALTIVSLAGAGVLVFGERAGKSEFAKRKVVHIDDGVLAPSKPTQPANFLLIGHDADGNSDTMMVVHVDPANPTPLLVSFPRDLIVDIPGHGRGQLNAAIGIGGPSLLIATFKSYFHVPVNHFIQVDFASFPEIVGTIGKVKVWFPTPVHDPYIGLDIEHAGCVALDGAQALAYARSRHYYVPDDPAHPVPWVWNYAPGLAEDAYRGGKGWSALGSDIDRIPRQQYFLRTLAQAAITRTNDDPLRIIGLVDAVMSHLTTDQSLKLDELKSLVRTFRRLRPSDVEMTTIPWSSDPDNHSRVVTKYPEANALLFRLASFSPSKSFLPPLVDPGTVHVRVVNGSGVTGLGGRALAQLVAAGFTSIGPSVDVGGNTYARTEVRWGAYRDVEGVTATYETGAKVSGQAAKASDTGSADVLVVVGRDWDQLEHHFAVRAKVPTTTGGSGGSGSSKSATPTSAASTTTGGVSSPYVPVDPKTGGVLVGCPKS